MFNDDQLTSWREFSNNHITIRGAESFFRKKPKLLNPPMVNSALLSYIYSILDINPVVISDIDVYYLEEAYFSDLCFVYGANLALFPPSGIDQVQNLNFQDLKHYVLGDIPQIAGDGLVIFKAGKGNYGHFLVEMAPKLFAAAKMLDLRAVKILIPTLPNPIKDIFNYIIKYIENILGFSLDLYEMKTPLIKCDRLLYIGPITKHNKHKSTFIREFIIGLKDYYKGALISSSPKKIYMCRDAPYRNIVNDDDVKNLFIKYGFTVINPEKLSFEEQISLFSNADFIAGPHGAGMTNICFMSPNANVFMIDPGLHDFFFWDLACLFDLNFSWFFNDLFPYSPEKASEDYHVNVELLEDRLKEVLEI
jgi:hypothetical protein